MGRVFEAFDLHLKKTVAIKTISRSNISDNELARFHREARLASTIEHLNVVKTLDFGVEQDRFPYLVMEYVPGATLRRVLRESGRLDCSSAVDILVQICEGVSVIHQAGIVHRDLKTSNVMISEDDNGQPLARLLDFGTARIFSDSDGSLTELGLIVGTPKYLSPEQALGGEVDERSDIYSLGCIAFELLTGRVPYEGNSSMATIDMHISSPVPMLPSDLDAAPLDVVVQRMLSKEPNQRYATVGEVKDALLSARSEVDSQPLFEAETQESFEEDGEDSIVRERKVQYRLILAIVGLLVVAVGAPVISRLFSPVKHISLSTDVDYGIQAVNEQNVVKSTRVLSGLESKLKSGELYADGQVQSIVYTDPMVSRTISILAKYGKRVKCVFVDAKLEEKDVSNIVKLQPRWVLIARSNIKDEDIERLSRCPSIEQLRLFRDKNLTDDCLQYLTRLPRLNFLSVRGCNFGNKALGYISKLSGITQLDLEDNPRIDMSGFKKLKDCPRLRVVTIAETGIEMSSAECREFEKSSGLTKIWRETTFDSNQAIQCIEMAKQMELLKNGLYDSDLSTYYSTNWQTE